MNSIDSRKFVKAWMTCDSVDAVAAKLKISKQQTSSKANILRKAGVKLPKKLNGGHKPTYNVDELNAIIDSFGKPTTTKEYVVEEKPVVRNYDTIKGVGIRY